MSEVLHFNQETIQRLQGMYDEFTAVEKSIADFFVQNTEHVDFSARQIAARLYVSEASLSRFAKKCGYRGFREFIFNYERDLTQQKDISVDELTGKVISTYRTILEESLKLVNGTQINRISRMLSACKRVYVYGMGSSGIAAQEFKLRFMRLGMAVDAMTDAHTIRMTSALLDSDVLVIALSVSALTPEILSGISIAKEYGAKVILVSANNSAELTDQCDEVLRIASIKDLELGLEISPQFPILVMVDIFFSYYLNTDYYNKSARHTDTIAALYKGF